MYYQLIGQHLKTYPLIVILILGLLGNGMIFSVFMRKNFMKSSITKYMRILAVLDSVAVCSGSIPNIYDGFAVNRTLTAMSTTGCILHRFIMFYSSDVAVWILTVITIDRLVAVVYPLKNSRWKSKKNTFFILVFVFLLGWIKNFPIFFTLTIEKNNRCDARKSAESYEYIVRPVLSLILYYCVPAATLTVCTVLIIRRMNKMIERMNAKSNHRKMTMVFDQKAHYSKSLTKMSIAINILFFILITPSIIIWTMLSYTRVEKLLLLYDITNILVFSHHSLNFYLFFLTGPSFRREVLTIFGKKYVNAEDSREYSNKKSKNKVSKCTETNCS